MKTPVDKPAAGAREDSHRRLKFIVDAWRRGEVTTEVVCRAAYRALHEECAGCQNPAPTEPAAPPEQVVTELESLVELVDSIGGWEAALEAIAAEPSRYDSPELAAALTAKAQAELPGELERSKVWARLAAAVAGLGTGPESRERLAQALAFQGNAVRALQERGLAAAEPWFASARALLAQSGTHSIAVAADIDRLEASLARNQFRYETATQLFLRAISLYLILGDETLVARTTLSLALTYSHAGHQKKAIEMVRAAYAWSTEAEDDTVRFLSLFSLTCNLESIGRLADARQALELARRVEGRPDGAKIQRNLQWVETLLDAHEGSDRELAALWALYREFLATESFCYDSLGMLFDIARLTWNLGRSSELPRVVDELMYLLRKTPIQLENSREFLLRLLEQSEITPWLDPRNLPVEVAPPGETSPESP